MSVTAPAEELAVPVVRERRGAKVVRMLTRAPVHILLIPKRHITTVLDLRPEDSGLVMRLLEAIQIVARKLGLDERGFYIRANVMPPFQHTGHVHIHLLHHVKGPALDYLGIAVAAFLSWAGFPGPGEPVLIAAAGDREGRGADDGGRVAGACDARKMRAREEHHRKAADDRSDEADDGRPEKSRLHRVVVLLNPWV